MINPTAEHVLLKFLLLNPRQFDQITNKIHIHDFNDLKVKYIYNLLLDLHKQKKIWDLENINLFLTTTPESKRQNVTDYLKLVMQKSPLCQLSEIDNYIQKIQKDSSEKEIEQIFKTTSLFETPKDLMDSILKETIFNPSQNGLLGFDTGFDQLNHDTLGFQKKELIILGARPGVGKTTLMMNLAINIITKNTNTKIVVFSLEMSNTQLILKSLSSVANVDMRRLRLGEVSEKEKKTIIDSSRALEQLQLFFDDQSSLVSEIEIKCSQFKQTHGLDIVFIDYLQLLQDKPVDKISQKLKQLAKKLNIIIFCLAQLNRDSAKSSTPRRPKLTDLKDTGNIEQDADLVMLLYREANIIINKLPQSQYEQYELIIAKNRNGVTNTTYQLNFNNQTQTFTEQIE